MFVLFNLICTIKFNKDPWVQLILSKFLKICILKFRKPFLYISTCAHACVRAHTHILTQIYTPTPWIMFYSISADLQKKPTINLNKIVASHLAYQTLREIIYSITIFIPTVIYWEPYYITKALYLVLKKIQKFILYNPCPQSAYLQLYWRGRMRANMLPS